MRVAHVVAQSADHTNAPRAIPLQPAGLGAVDLTRQPVDDALHLAVFGGGEIAELQQRVLAAA